jgi:hypothetical protein
LSLGICLTQAAGPYLLPDEQNVTAKSPQKNDAEESLQTAGKNGRLRNSEQLATSEDETVNMHLGSSDETDVVNDKNHVDIDTSGVDIRDSVFGCGSSADDILLDDSAFEIEDSGVGDSCVNESDITSTSIASEEGRQKMTPSLASNGSAWMTAQSKIHEDMNATVSLCTLFVESLTSHFKFGSETLTPHRASQTQTAISEWDSTKNGQYKRRLCLYRIYKMG